jgi:hypothetical protein
MSQHWSRGAAQAQVQRFEQCRMSKAERLASPICWHASAAPMKTFLDRICDFLDLPELLESSRLLRGKDANVACTSMCDEASAHFPGAFQDTFESNE